MYFFMVVFYVLGIVDLSGLGGHLFLPDVYLTFPGRAAMSSALWNITAILFSIVLLKGPHMPKWIQYMFYGFAFFYVSSFCTILLGYAQWGASLVNVLPLFWCPLMLAHSSYQALKHSRPALYYLVGFGPVQIGLVLYILNSRGLLVVNGYVEPVLYACAAWEAMWFSQALAQRVNELKRAREDAQKHAAEVDAELAAVERKRTDFDHLTGLASRENIRRTGDLWLANGIEPLVLVINIDRFKAINDILGYSNGDEVLIVTGRRLSSIPDVVVSRLHANQFCLISKQAATFDDLQRRLDTMFKQPLLIGGHSVDISLSVGVMAHGPQDMDMIRRIRNAELALLEGRRTYTDWLNYDIAMETSHQDDLAFLSALRNAVDEDELRLYLQPKVRLSDESSNSAEALVRWQHPERGLLFPSDFISFAEKTGCIGLITRWMLREAMRFAQACRSSGQSLQISVNLSMHDLRDKHLVDGIVGLLAETGANPADIRLEMTETLIMDDPVEMLAVMRDLKEHGFEMSVDDFGTGYSSLAYLQKMPVTELKIDRSFVSRARPGSDAETLLDSVISLGHRLDLTVVAEGVETREEWQLLRSLGCDYVQGWLIAKAMPMEEFNRWRQMQVGISAKFT